ncbi:pre-mRNA cleavage and polyadenylation factor (CPF) complex subunit [Vanrija albida]|uniref:Polyadenylation factor subunit 2 n=1 Tax=Vanrija albida TaxID=181172 RepID=A0ABR3Q6E7_9TREE
MATATATVTTTAAATATASDVAGPSRPREADTWKPTKYLEPNHPDNEEVLEQAAYQAAVTRPPGDARANRKYKPRRTVDYMGGIQKFRMLGKMKGVHPYLPPIYPSPSDIINLLPPVAHIDNPSTSICDYFVHTSINKERSPTRVVQWTPDARRLLTGNDKGQFTLWNGASFNYESITQVHDDSIRSMSYSHNGQYLVSCDKSGSIKYFTPHLTNIHGFQGHREACHGVAWSPNDERFVTGGDDGLVKIWNYRAATAERELSGHGWDVRCVDWHPTKGLVVSGSKDMLVKFWDPRTGKDLSTLHSHKAVVNACSWNAEGHIVATAGGDGLIRLFDIRTFRELEPMKGHTKEVNCLAWHPIHHSLLASGDAAGSINYWSLKAPDPSKPVTSLEAAHDDAVFSLSFHPLGHILCSGSKDFTARFWCRARPQGGHEIDRYHLGEEGALRAEMDQEEAKPSRWPGLPGREGNSTALPGLPGLTGGAARPPPPSNGPPPPRSNVGPPGLGGPPSGPPGLGGNSPVPGPPGLNRPASTGPPGGPGGMAPGLPVQPARRQWGNNAGGGGGGRDFGNDHGGGGGGGGGGGDRWRRPGGPPGPPGGGFGAGGGQGGYGGQQGGPGGFGQGGQQGGPGGFGQQGGFDRQGGGAGGPGGFGGQGGFNGQNNQGGGGYGRDPRQGGQGGNGGGFQQGNGGGYGQQGGGYGRQGGGGGGGYGGRR